MQCNFCDKKATVFLTQLVDGEMKKMCLCEECAEEKGVTDPAGFSLGDSLMEEGVPFGDGPVAVSADDGEPCPVCGFTLKKFQQVGRLGCSECYQAFSDEISKRLKGMHKGTIHRGRVPEGLVEAHARQQRLDKLQTKLDEAIASENYEEAASLRDEIEEIETTVAAQV